MKLTTNRITLKARQIPKFICGVAVAGIIGLSSCSSDSGTTEEQVVEYTQGLVTYVEEVDSSDFKITDEVVVPTKDDSRIIATYLDGTKDTFNLQEARLVASGTSDGSDNYQRRSGMSGVLMGGMMGYFLGRSMSSPTSPGAYKNQAAYQKSQTSTASTLKSTAKTTTVRKPSTGKSGYGGSSRSTRSYGG